MGELVEMGEGKAGRALTEMQEAFVLHLTSTPGCIGDAVKAAKAAGFSDKNLSATAHQLTVNVRIQAAIRAANLAWLASAAGTEALRVMAEIMRDPEAGNRERLAAATALADRAGFTKTGENPIGPGNKHPSEMTEEELSALLARLDQRAAKAKMVTSGAADSAASEQIPAGEPA